MICFRFLLTCWFVSAFIHVTLAQQPPNVVLILADDLGWTDLACYGSDFYETPALDRLATTGMRFTQAYSACTVCSPTRAALLTGKYPARLHITDWIPGLMPDNPKLLVPNWTKHLTHDEVTLAERFHEAGYATASIGKWHLGGEAYYPMTQGFDINIAGTDQPAPSTYFAPWQIPTLDEGDPNEYLTGRLAEEAVKFITDHKDQPFFLYLPHYAVHTPINGRRDLVEKYRTKLRPEHRHRNIGYAAMIEALDQAVGRVLDHLDALQLNGRTIVVFTSDNGGLITRQVTTNTPLRYGKASAYEGGVRVPLMIRWPGVTQANTESSTPVITMDLTATLRDALGPIARRDTLPKDASLPDPLGMDGLSLRPLLDQSGTLPDRNLYWHYPHHQHYQLGGATPYSAMRHGDYKLIEFHNDGRRELYNLASDIGETLDLAPIHPELVTELADQLYKWRESIGAQMPTPNPNFDPAKPEYNPPPKK